MGRLKRRVLKFGGTSLGSVEPLRCALGIASEAARAGPVTVVVSALAGVTNALEAGPGTWIGPEAGGPAEEDTAA
jgi:aspartokinase